MCQLKVTFFKYQTNLKNKIIFIKLSHCFKWINKLNCTKFIIWEIKNIRPFIYNTNIKYIKLNLT